MRTLVAGLWVVLMLTLGGAAAHAAPDQAPPIGQPRLQAPGTWRFTPGQERKPYSELFRSRDFSTSQSNEPKQIDPVPIPQPRIGPCGMVLFDARRGLDPAMLVAPPPGNFAIRRAVPPVCTSK